MPIVTGAKKTRRTLLAALCLVAWGIPLPGDRSLAREQEAGQTPLSRAGLIRFAIVPPAAQPLSISADRDLTISADGTQVAYIAGAAGQTAQLMVRAIDQLDAIPLAGITGPRSPFFSPDGRWVGYYAQRELRKVSIAGGPAITLCRTAGALRGASWSPDGMIVFATDAAGTGLFTVPAGGGEPRALTIPAQEHDERAHWFPSVLPGGRAVLFTIQAMGLIDTAPVSLAVLDLTTGQRKTLIRGGSQAVYLDSGHLVYAASGNLRAVRFDLTRLEVLSDPVDVVEQVMTKRGGAANFSISHRGTLVYVPGGAGSPEFKQNSLVWVNRQGGVEDPIQTPPHAYSSPRLSPDGGRVAVGIRDAERGYNDLGIGVWDLARQTLTPLTFRDIAFPVWTPDGRRIVFSSGYPRDAANLFSQSADGTGTVARLTTSSTDHWPQSISPNASSLVFIEFTKTSSGLNWNLGLLSLDGPLTPVGVGDPQIRPLMQTTATEKNAEISPDGRWLAYQSNESGRDEVYVRPFPKVQGGRWQISTGGGTGPAWARSGKELFYVDAGGLLMAVPVQTTRSFGVGHAMRVLHTRYFTSDPFTGGIRNYDVSSDGQRFLMIKDTPATIVVVVNWLDELKRRAPTR